MSPVDPLQRIAASIRRAGIHLPRQKSWLLERRVHDRAREHGCDAEQYAVLLQSPEGAEELRLLVEAVRVGETRFFRLGTQQRALRRVALPELAARRAGRGPLTVWCAGCASGEEPYTVAMIIEEWLQGEDRPPLEYQVLATDLSQAALDTARTGRYSKATVATVPTSSLQRFFEPCDPGYRVNPALAARVRFRLHDLVEQPYPGGFDLVVCRNVLIYFERSTRESVARRLATSVAPHGFLFLGEGEVLEPPPPGFERLRTSDGLIYQRVDPGAVASCAQPADPTPAAVPASGSADLLIRLTGSYDEEEASDRLRRELRGAVEDTVRPVLVDLDGATYLAPRCARVLRRLADSLGPARLVLVASRPGVVHWVRRHRELLRGIPCCGTVDEARVAADEPEAGR